MGFMFDLAQGSCKDPCYSFVEAEDQESFATFLKSSGLGGEACPAMAEAAAAMAEEAKAEAGDAAGDAAASAGELTEEQKADKCMACAEQAFADFEADDSNPCKMPAEYEGEYDAYIQETAGARLLDACEAEHCTEALLGSLDQEGQDALYGLACPTIFKSDQRKKKAEELGCKLPETCGFLGFKCWFKKKCTEDQLNGTAAPEEDAKDAALLYSLPQPQYCPL